MKFKIVPKITCAILCYNYGQYLAQAIDSCLHQTLDNNLYEILIIDDGSTDNTQPVCALYGDKIRVSRSNNLGFTKSIERALIEAKGEYVAYLDADDWWEPEKLQIIFNALKEGIYSIIHPMNEVDGQGISLNNIGSCGNTSSVCVHRMAGLTLMPSTSEIFAQVFIKVGKGIVLNKVLANYRIHAKSMTDRSYNTKHTEFFANTNFVLANNLYKIFNDLPFWADNKYSIKKVADFYYSEGRIKDFQRTTELKKTTIYDFKLICNAMFVAKRLPQRRELRLLIRLILQKIGLG